MPSPEKETDLDMGLLFGKMLVVRGFATEEDHYGPIYGARM